MPRQYAIEVQSVLSSPHVDDLINRGGDDLYFFAKNCASKIQSHPDQLKYYDEFNSALKQIYPEDLLCKLQEIDFETSGRSDDEMLDLLLKKAIPDLTSLETLDHNISLESAEELVFEQATLATVIGEEPHQSDDAGALHTPTQLNQLECQMKQDQDLKEINQEFSALCRFYSAEQSSILANLINQETHLFNEITEIAKFLINIKEYTPHEQGHIGFILKSLQQLSEPQFSVLKKQLLFYDINPKRNVFFQSESHNLFGLSALSLLHIHEDCLLFKLEESNREQLTREQIAIAIYIFIIKTTIGEMRTMIKDLHQVNNARFIFNNEFLRVKDDILPIYKISTQQINTYRTDNLNLAEVLEIELEGNGEEQSNSAHNATRELTVAIPKNPTRQQVKNFEEQIEYEIEAMLNQVQRFQDITNKQYLDEKYASENGTLIAKFLIDESLHSDPSEVDASIHDKINALGVLDIRDKALIHESLMRLQIFLAKCNEKIQQVTLDMNEVNKVQPIINQDTVTLSAPNTSQTLQSQAVIRHIRSQQRLIIRQYNKIISTILSEGKIDTVCSVVRNCRQRSQKLKLSIQSVTSLIGTELTNTQEMLFASRNLLAHTKNMIIKIIIFTFNAVYLMLKLPIWMFSQMLNKTLYLNIKRNIQILQQKIINKCRFIVDISHLYFIDRIQRYLDQSRHSSLMMVYLIKLIKISLITCVIFLLINAKALIFILKYLILPDGYFGAQLIFI